MPPAIEKQAGPEFSDLEWRFALLRACSLKQAYSGRCSDERSTPEPIPPERLRLASAEIRHLSAIVRQLVELRNEE